ncbi:MAG: hypothetical protein WBV82_06315 [Myxococcaceae bacterium]
MIVESILALLAAAGLYLGWRDSYRVHLDVTGDSVSPVTGRL